MMGVSLATRAVGADRHRYVVLASVNGASDWLVGALRSSGMRLLGSRLHFLSWTEQVDGVLRAMNAHYPFLAYGTDWLAFAHLVITVAFIGPYLDPVRNKWVIAFGLIACAGPAARPDLVRTLRM